MDQFKQQETIKQYFEAAYAYAYFGTIAKAGLGIGGARGTGDVYVINTDGADTLIGFSTLTQLSYGFQFGGQLFSEMIFFESEKDLKSFTEGNFEFGATANVIAIATSAGAKATTMGNQVNGGFAAGSPSVQYTKGMAVFTIAQGGLMYEASISGQQIRYKPVTTSS